MNAPQGIFHFPGVDDFVSGTYTLSHGTHPGMCTLRIPPQERLPNRGGTLTLSYGGFTQRFTDCVLDSIDFEGDDNKQVWTLRILDRRWLWRSRGAIGGQYNTRTTDKQILKSTEKTPQELFRLLFDAIGERRVDVSQVPNEERPEVSWDYEQPAAAIDQLANKLGCRVVLRLDGSVMVAKSGIGQKLPGLPTEMDRQEMADPPELPPTIIYAAPRIWQIDAALEPVGVDLDGSIKPIDRLSYRPLNGWSLSDVLGECASVRGRNRQEYERASALARETVFRWYRLKTPIRMPTTAGGAGVLNDLTELVLLDRQVETGPLTGPGGAAPAAPADAMAKIEGDAPRRPMVYGLFAHRTHAREVTGVPVDFKLQTKEQLWDHGFEIDRDRCIVKFREPVFRLVAPPAGLGLPRDMRTLAPAEIYLRVATMARDSETRGPKRWEWRKRIGNGIGGAKYIIGDDDHPVTAYFDYSGGAAKVVTNVAEMAKHAAQKIDEYIRKAAPDGPASGQWAGFLPIQPDGAIQQVTWSVTDSGLATTRASRQHEELIPGASYEERQLLNRLQMAEANQRKRHDARRRTFGVRR